jgi:hypothetical protein
VAFLLPKGNEMTDFTAPPTPPQRSDAPATFISRADAFIAWFVTFYNELVLFIASLNLISTTASSTTSNSIGIGAKSFIVETGKSFSPGMYLVIADSVAPSTNSISVQVTSYNSVTGALVVNSLAFSGTGTKTAWTISQSSSLTPLDNSVSTIKIQDEAVTNAKLDDLYLNDQTAVIPAIDDYLALADTSNSGNKKKTLISSLISLFYSDVSRAVPVRQTVLNGTVDSSGLPSFGGATGATTVTTSTTLTATAANGTVNRTGSIVNPSWTGLSTNGIMYLYLDIDAAGVCTPGSTTLAPNYRWGGADVTTNNQFTFNIQEMTGKVGNGSAAVQTYRVFIGEVLVAAGVVSTITWYALMGRYDSDFTATLPAAGTLTSKNHNIGVADVDAFFVMECTTIDLGYAVGDRRFGTPSGFETSNYHADGLNTTYKTVSLSKSGGYYSSNKSGAAGGNLTTTSWKYKFTAKRGW